ncbi:uncharacterized protein TNCV_676081 [Trichonephila clavipes]|nr:uncharacterized protein TNCV_676081 [Trichonephila clavipes]
MQARATVEHFPYQGVAAVAEWYRYRIVACLVTSSSPVPLKTRRVGQRCTLNLSRAETSSRWTRTKGTATGRNTPEMQSALFQMPSMRTRDVAAVAEWYRYRTVACFVTGSSPVPLKTRRVGQRCTLNLSRANVLRWCGVIVRRGVPAQVSSTSLDHGSKLRGPSPKALV